MAQKRPSVAVPVEDEAEAPTVPSNQRWKESSEEKCGEKLKCSQKTISVGKRKLPEKLTYYEAKMKKTEGPSCKEKISDRHYEESLQLDVNAGPEAASSNCSSEMMSETANKEHRMTSQLDQEKTNEDGPFYSCQGTSKPISSRINVTGQRSIKAIPKQGGTSVIPPALTEDDDDDDVQIVSEHNTIQYSSKAPGREKQIVEEEIKAEVVDERRKAQDEDLDEKLRKQMQIKKRGPAVAEELFDEEERKEEKLPELTDDMQEKISDWLRPGQQVLTEKFKLQITRNDIATLGGLNWLNDKIINFYMNLLVERGKQVGNSTVYAFNTFFYPKILSGGQAAVKRWTRRVDIFAHDYILIPVHLDKHWCLAVVTVKKKQVKFYDSMGKDNVSCLNVIEKYLCDESKDKKKQEFNLQGWTFDAVKDIPQQMNGSDCGMFACKYAEYITRGAPITFTQQNMPYFRRRMVYEIVTGKLLQ